MAFAGRAAFVTGAASGIGRATALAFAAEGANVALVDRDADACAQTLALLQQAGKGNGRVLVCEVTDADAVNQAVADTVAAWGRIDCAANAAAVEGATP